MRAVEIGWDKKWCQEESNNRQKGEDQVKHEGINIVEAQLGESERLGGWGFIGKNFRWNNFE